MSRAAACDAWFPRSPTSLALVDTNEPTHDQSSEGPYQKLNEIELQGE